MDQGDRNARQDNQQGGQNKPLRPEEPTDHEQSRETHEGRDEPPPTRPGGEKSPWLGGG
jgi:hypothetical protein